MGVHPSYPTVDPKSQRHPTFYLRNEHAFIADAWHVSKGD